MRTRNEGTTVCHPICLFPNLHTEAGARLGHVDGEQASKSLQGFAENARFLVRIDLLGEK
jgi:hypothetical protein